LKKILIVEDHPIVLESLGLVTRSVFPDATIYCAGDCREAESIVASVGELDLVLLDLGLPGCAGIGSLTCLRELAPTLSVVVVSAMEEREVILAALEAGASGYIPKSSRPEVIRAALRIVAAGSIYVPVQAIGTPRCGEIDPQAPALTVRQLDVLRLITRGFANKEIAAQLRIAKDTVKQHAKAVYTALGVACRSHAARAAGRRGIKLR
jgi:DNA-binding NarL/FixJ family response regulator